MLGRCARAKVVRPIGFTDKSNYTYPLNYALLYGTPSEEYAFILGIDHEVKNFDGRIVAVLEPKNKSVKRIWILAPKSTRYINLDILKHIDVEKDFPNHRLVCLYETSSGAVVYRNINGKTRFLLIKNKRSSNWGFPKGHLEKGESNSDAAKREVLEETGIHIVIHEGFESVSKYKIKNRIDKMVSIFLATTDDVNTVIQEEEIEDYVWLPYGRALMCLGFENDKNILRRAYKFLTANDYIPKK